MRQHLTQSKPHCPRRANVFFLFLRDNSDAATHYVAVMYLQVDPRAVAYFTQIAIGMSVLVFAGTQLIRLEECPQQQAYLGLFTFVIGLLLPNPSISSKRATPAAVSWQSRRNPHPPNPSEKRATIFRPRKNKQRFRPREMSRWLVAG